jgi:hypothetical protein
MTTTVQKSQKACDLTEPAAAVGSPLAEYAAGHDSEGRIVTVACHALRHAGLLKAGVPVELGGHGATMAELTGPQRELAHHGGSSALTSSMRQHIVAFTAWRYRRDLPGAEASLRPVAACDLSVNGADESTDSNGPLIERCYRDIRLAKFHPLTIDDTLVETGRHVLGINGQLG